MSTRHTVPPDAVNLLIYKKLPGRYPVPAHRPQEPSYLAIVSGTSINLIYSIGPVRIHHHQAAPGSFHLQPPSQAGPGVLAGTLRQSFPDAFNISQPFLPHPALIYRRYRCGNLSWPARYNHCTSSLPLVHTATGRHPRAAVSSQSFFRTAFPMPGCNCPAAASVSVHAIGSQILSKQAYEAEKELREALRKDGKIAS